MHNITPTHKHAVMPLLILLVLLGGVVFSLDQAKRQQDQRSQAAGTNDCTVTDAQMQIKAQEQELFDLVNEYRTQNGVPTMTWSTKLKKSSAWMSKDMSTSGRLLHTDSLNRPPDVRLVDCGFTSSTFGETLASGPPVAADVLTTWKASQTHSQLLLGSEYTQAGVSYELDATTQLAYWTMNMGAGEMATTVAPTTLVTTGPTSAVPTTVAPTSANPTITPPLDPNNPTPTSGRVSVNMQIAVKVKIGGIGQGGNQSPVNLSRKVYADVYGTGNELVGSGNAFLSYDGTDYFTGTINLGKMSEGVYIVKLASSNSLEAIVEPEFQQLLADKLNTLPAVTLMQGDIDQDNILNLTDYNIALPCFQNAKCDKKAEIDFNDDGTTDVKDYNLLLKSFGEYQGN